jgi:DNA (cytosine-5)-methyltransferase 1
MTHGSLFSGIGGFDYAAKEAGITNLFWCEKEPFCQRALKYHYPTSQAHEDITKTDFTKYRGAVDIISGGFPCQPFSTSGKRLGNEDDRALWHEMYRAIREVEPTWVIAENVRGLLSIEDGMVFEQVCTDLETAGYEVQAFIIPAVGKNARHRRDRLWIVAHATNARAESLRKRTAEVFRPACFIANAESKSSKLLQSEQRKDSEQEKRELGGGSCNVGSKRATPNATSTRLQGAVQPRTSLLAEHLPNEQTESPICSGDDGLSGRLFGITVPKHLNKSSVTVPKHRKESLKAYGNAIVPQIAYAIFQAILQTENR